MLLASVDCLILKHMEARSVVSSYYLKSYHQWPVQRTNIFTNKKTLKEEFMDKLGLWLTD